MRRKNVETLIEQLKSKKIDMVTRSIPFAGGSAYICFISQLVDRQAIAELVIKPIMEYCATSKRDLDAAYTIDHLLYVDDCLLGEDFNRVESYVLGGQTVILFNNDPQYVVVNRRKVVNRNVSPPELMYSYRAPRDAFVEELDTNLSLMRYRMKDGNIRIVKKVVGARTKSTVAVVYIEDIANPSVVDEINKRIDGIQTDGIYESGELQGFLLNHKINLFPQMGMIERSDMAVEKLLQGKVLVLVDGSNIVLQAPMVFTEFLEACDDRYDNKFFGLFMRIIRYFALFLTLTATSYYIAFAEYHPDALPASYIVTFAQMRSKAPFSSLIAVIILEFIVELVRESIFRVPVKIGATIGIVGAVIIGQAASSSGVFSPLLLILVSIGFLASFAIPDITFGNPVRILKFLVIIMTGFFGFYGFSLAMTLILAMIVSVNSFGVPYMAPLAPFNFYDFVRSLIFSKTMSPKRQQYMRDLDDTRMPVANAQAAPVHPRRFFTKRKSPK